MTTPVNNKPVLNFGSVSSMEQVAQNSPNLQSYAKTVQDDYQQIQKDPSNSADIRKYAVDASTLAAHEGIDPNNANDMQALQNGIVSALQSAGVSQQTLDTAFVNPPPATHPTGV